jgi:hypothetical protein
VFAEKQKRTHELVVAEDLFDVPLKRYALSSLNIFNCPVQQT